MVSNNFINECKNSAYENRLAKIKKITDETTLTENDYIQDFTIDSGCSVNGSIIGTTYAKKVNINLLDTNKLNLIDEKLNIQVGIKYDDEETEYLDLGNYKVETPKNGVTENYSSITAYDDLINNLDNPYICNIDFTSSKTFLDLYIDLCKNLDLTPKTLDFINNDLPLIGNPFTNNETNRVVLESIEKVSCSFAQVNENNELELCWLSQNEEPDYTFNQDDYSNLDGGKVTYGPINSLVIKMSSIDDENVSISDEESIKVNGENQLVISEDYLLYNAELRELAIEKIWNKVHNLKYIDCTLTTYYGKPFLKIGDKIRIYQDEENYFDTYVLNHQFKYDGAFTSIIKSPALTKQQIATKQDVSLKDRLRETQIIVDKVNGLIKEVTSSVQKVDEALDVINGDYVLTEDTTFQEDKNYYILIGENYELYTDYEVGEEITIELYELDGGIRNNLTNLQEQVDSNTSKISENYEDVLNKLEDYAPNTKVDSLENRVERLQTDTYTKTEIQQIANGTYKDENGKDVNVSAVISEVGQFDKDGMLIQKEDENNKIISETVGRFNEKGVQVKRVNNGSANEEVFFGGYVDDNRFDTGTRQFKNSSIVYTKNLVARGDTIIGNHGLVLDYENKGHQGTGWFIV